MALEWRCPKHPFYKGLRKTKTDCLDCRELYVLNEAVRLAHKMVKMKEKSEVIIEAEVG